MPYNVHIKKGDANEISEIIKSGIKTFTVDNLVITDGLLYKGNYAIPVQSILFIEGV